MFAVRTCNTCITSYKFRALICEKWNHITIIYSRFSNCLTPVTFGASLGLLIPGATIAGTGGVALAGARIGYLAISQTKLKDANNACKADRELMRKVKELGEKCFNKLDFLAKKHNSTWEKMFVFIRHHWSSKSGFRATHGGYKTVDAISGVAAVAGHTVWSTLSTVGQVVCVGGTIFDAALIPVDLVVMFKSAYDIHQYKTKGESNSNVAKDIGQVITDLENNRDELQKFFDELGTTL